MPSILEQCEEFFGTKELYTLFSVSKTALEKDITKAYYKLALKVHPDRVSEEEKEIATEKFKVLTKLHLVLTTKEKRALYDEQGIVGDDDDEAFGANWMDTWRQFFKPISEEDITNYEKQYVGSDLEKTDIKKAYLNGNGCMDFIFNSVPFMTIESEPRIIEIVKEMIQKEEVPEYQLFLNEPKAKRTRRHKKYAREAKEADELKEQMATADLEKQIMKRQKERQNGFHSFLDSLVSKYGGNIEDDSEDYEPSPSKRRKTDTPTKKTKTPNKKDTKPTLKASKSTPTKQVSKMTLTKKPSKATPKKKGKA